MNQNISKINYLFDTHVHLNDKRFQDDIENHIIEMQKQGIRKVLCVGYDHKSNSRAIELSKAYPNLIYAAIGFHPTSLNGLNDNDLIILKEQLQEESVVALGEIGLDYHWDTTTKELQFEYFIKQINIAKEVGKPIIIHSREATKDTYQILKEQDISSIGGIMHSYASSYEMALEFIKLNMMVSLSGVVTFKNARKTKEVALRIPLEHLLIETDCPYLTPEPYRGKMNFPQYSYYVALEIAEQKLINVDEVIKQTYHNACKFLKIDENS